MGWSASLETSPSGAEAALGTFDFKEQAYRPGFLRDENGVMADLSETEQAQIVAAQTAALGIIGSHFADQPLVQVVLGGSDQPSEVSVRVFVAA